MTSAQASPEAVPRRPRRWNRSAGWILTTVRTILANPRYTGHQVWNRQRTDHALIDPANTSLGHRDVMRWNAPTDWIISTTPAHPELVSEADTAALKSGSSSSRDFFVRRRGVASVRGVFAVQTHATAEALTGCPGAGTRQVDELITEGAGLDGPLRPPDRHAPPVPPVSRDGPALRPRRADDGFATEGTEGTAQ
ncbi:recombinase family protein [Streptomyces sp. 900105755]|uniref:recombinase family protein n=1 Tax=Streptomyces sp. 900105755 TaxID=3154389 RepID=UPI00331D18F4